MNMESTFENFCHENPTVISTVTVGDSNFAIVALLFHVSLYVNPRNTPSGSVTYDDRYCMASPEVAMMAIDQFQAKGEIAYWQKHHNKHLISSGGYIYGPDTPREPKYAIKSCDWDADDLRENFPYRPWLHLAPNA